MKAQYDALIRQSQPVSYWPLGRALGRDVVAGNHFTTLPTAASYSHEIDGDYTRIIDGKFSRTRVMTATNNFTMECWFRTFGPIQWAWGLENVTGGSNGYNVGASGPSGQISGVAQGVVVLETSPRAAPRGVWNHFVFMRNATVWQYIVNTVLYSTGANTQTPNAPGGAAVSSVTATNTDAQGCAFYTRVLTPSEILDHYLMGVAHIGPMFVASPDTTVLPLIIVNKVTGMT